MEPTLILADAFVLHLSGTAATSDHATPILKLIVPLGARLQIRVVGRGELITTAAILTKPGFRHAVACDGPVLALMLPTHRAAGLARRGEQGLERLSTRETEALVRATQVGVDRLDSATATDLVAELIARLSPGDARLDARVLRVLERLDRLDGSTPPLDQLAREVGLSRFRLAHLFAEQVGVPIRRYALWRRLGQAAAALASGQGQAAAAVAAGFADQAHLCRTARALVGRPTSAMTEAF